MNSPSKSPTMSPLRILAQGVAMPSAPGGRQSMCFPSVCVLPSGRWLCACRAAPTKAGMDGQHPVISWSDNQGQSWSEPIAPWSPPAIEGKPGQLRGSYISSLGGQEVAALLYWVDYSHPELPFFNPKTEGLLDSRVMLSRSADGGQSWSPPVLLNTAPYTVPIAFTGPILRNRQGEWLLQFELNKPYNDEGPWVHKPVIMFSADQGRTWPTHTVPVCHPENRVYYWDQRVAVAPSGQILGLYWTYDREKAAYLNIHATTSDDGGKTWAPVWDTGVAVQPAPAVALPGGRWAMAYVDRTGAAAIRMRTSSDGGRTWPAETVVTLHDSGVNPNRTKKNTDDAWVEMEAFAVGLPCAAALPNGEVLVVYYAGEKSDKTDIRWARLGA